MADPEGPSPEEESFLRRWSRRKAEARGALEPPGEAPAGSGPGEAPQRLAQGAEGPEGPAIPASDTGAQEGALPDPEEVHEDSDVSAFLAPGVDSNLQQRALRRLFRSSKFNFVDGLEVYDGDYRSFESLGQVITAHLRHRMRFEAEKALREMTEPPGEGDQEGWGDTLVADGRDPARTEDPSDSDAPGTEPT